MKLMVPRQLLHSDTGHLIVSPATQPLTIRIQNASYTFSEPHVPVVPTVLVVFTLVP